MSKGRDDDTDLFERAMQGVRPLRERPARAAAATAPAKPVTTAQPLPRPAQQPVTPRRATADMAGMDKRQADRFRRGQMSIDAKLDLHGCRQAEAHRRLLGFVERAHQRGHRCLLVITGKGGRPDPDADDADFMPDRAQGVLRRNLPRWLQEPGLREKVLSVSPARSRHGGDGAFYVLLRRRRERGT